jgi:predicted RND superfamily exporter protein
MKRLLSAISRYITHLPDQVIRARLLVLVLFAVATAVCVYGMTKLKFDFTIETWLQQDDAAYVAYNEFHAQFGSDDGVVIVYKPKDGNVFSAQSLRAVKGIRDELINYRSKLEPGKASALDHIVEVNSLINAPVLMVKNDVLLSKWLVGSTVPTDPRQLEEIRNTAQAEREFPLKYFSKDLKYGAVYIKTDFGAIPVGADDKLSTEATINLSASANASDDGKQDVPHFKPTDMGDYVALNAALNQVLNKPEYRQVLDYYKVGNTIDSENQVKMAKEMGTLYLGALMIMLLSLFMLFRSFSGVVWPCLLMVLSVIWTLGIAGLLGLSASTFVILTILLILTVGMADITHLISGYMFFRHEGHDFRSAIRATYEKSGVACLLTTITSAVGMLSLLYGNLVPTINFSLMSAIGVCVVFFLAIYLLPILLGFWSPAPEKRGSRGDLLAGIIKRITPDFTPTLQKWLDKVVPAVRKRPYAFIAPFFVIFAVCVYGSFQVKVDYSIYDQYRPSSNFFQSIKLMDQKMAGSSRMSLYLDLGEDNAFQDPAVLHVIDDLQHKLQRDYSKYVVTTYSIVDVVKDAYQKQNEGREEMYRIPATREALSQTLFTFNVADPEERGRLVSTNYRLANVSVNLRSFGSYEYTDVFERMKQDINDSLTLIKQSYPKASISITGLFAMGMVAANYLVVNELQSFGASLLVISAILLVVFGSFKAGLISLIPNIIPSFLVLGILGLTGRPLDFYTMMLAPIAVGIAVDDTIHFVTVYRAAVLKCGDVIHAVTETVKECGQGIVFASMILGFGFGIMTVASTPGLVSLGGFGALAIFFGLVCEVFLTPALIIAFNLSFKDKKHASEIHAPVGHAPVENAQA